MGSPNWKKIICKIFGHVRKEKNIYTPNRLSILNRTNVGEYEWCKRCNAYHYYFRSRGGIALPPLFKHEKEMWDKYEKTGMW